MIALAIVVAVVGITAASLSIFLLVRIEVVYKIRLWFTQDMSLYHKLPTVDEKAVDQLAFPGRGQGPKDSGNQQGDRPP
jgi:hypothetical protein